jgi:hypothetical protein
MTMSVVTSVKTVGSKKLPPCAARLPPVTILAPFLTRLGPPDGISRSRMTEMLEVDKAGPKVRC